MADIEFRDDILKLHIMYIEKLELLTTREREAFCDYLKSLSKPLYFIEQKEINIKDFANIKN